MTDTNIYNEVKELTWFLFKWAKNRFLGLLKTNDYSFFFVCGFCVCLNIICLILIYMGQPQFTKKNVQSETLFLSFFFF